MTLGEGVALGARVVINNHVTIGDGAQIAATSIVHDICTSICTCWTSLVMRVISDGGPKCATSWAEYPLTEWKRLVRTSRPSPMAALDP